MKKKILLTILSFILCLSTPNVKDRINNKGNKNSNNIAAVADDVVTMKDIEEYLLTKEEHYPFSDEFVERHQQKSGGYIKNAKDAGIVVDKLQHSPNQKWHFFESWFYPSIADGTLSYEDTAKNRVYTKLLCPELLLWIYEACEVDPNKVRIAKEVAEIGKVAGTSTTTIAKNMRSCVAWEDLEKHILDKVDTSTKYTINVNNEIGFKVSSFSLDYSAGETIPFSVKVTDSSKEIDTVIVDSKVLTPIAGNVYSFTMPSKNTSISITLKEKASQGGTDSGDNTGGGNNDNTDNNDTPSIELPSDVEGVLYDIKYDLGTRTTAKLIESSTDLLSTFTLNGSSTSIINSISGFENIYGGGNGGSGDNKWYTGDLLKFGTTSKKGYIDFSLGVNVDSITIVGYVHNTAGKIRVGDSSSQDWSDNSTVDGKTTAYNLNEVNVANKDNVANKNVSVITISFPKTTNVKIATTNNYPLYISSIQFNVAKDSN